MQGKGLYPVMLTELRDFAQREGCKGIASYGAGRIRNQSSDSWKKFAKREARVQFENDGMSSGNYYFEGLAGLPKKGRIPLAGVAEDLGLKLRFTDSGDDEDEHRYTVEARTADGKWAGHVKAADCSWNSGWASVEVGEIPAPWQKKGLYPELLKFLRDEVKARGCAGVASYSGGRVDSSSTKSWEGFARREPRVKVVKNPWSDDGDTFLLSGLPKTGRIPLATVKRAAARLPKWTRKCGFTIAQLREGMETEREHRDVTRGGVLKTAKIAAAHLCEFKGGGYYPALKKLEKKLKRRK
jgi:hypothetical protein